jgi:RNA polymerase sigma-70 factor (ECF subfamily)
VGGAEPALRAPFSARNGAISAVSRDVRAGGGVIGAMTMEFDARFSPDELLAHSRWMRKLAVRLVGDSASADDLVQQTVAAWIAEGEVGQGFLRPWLATVMKNLARTNWRRDVRRRKREISTARSEVLEVDDTVATLEMHELLVGAIKGIAEAQRVVIVQHFFHEKSLAEIARELNLPESTVRNRLQRALEALRGKLDKRGGGRDNWVAMFIAFANRAKPSAALPAGTAASSATMGVLAWLGVAATLALLGVGAGYWWQRERQHGLDRESALLASAPQVRNDPTPELGVQPDRGGTRSSVADASASSPWQPPAAQDEDVATIDAHIVGADGMPLGSARISVHDRVDAGEIDSSQAPSAQSDRDGRVQLSVRPSDRYIDKLSLKQWSSPAPDPSSGRSWHLFIGVSAVGYETRLTTVELRSGHVTPLGDIQLRLGGSIAGRALTKDGAALPKCRADVFPIEDKVVGVSILAVRSAPVDADGKYLVTGVPIGTYRVVIHDTIGDRRRADSAPIEVRAGETSTADIVLHTGEISGTVRFPDGSPFSGQRVRYVASSLAEATPDQWTSVGTNDEGRFEITWPRQDTCDLLIVSDGRVAGDLMLPSIAAGTQELELQLPPPTWIPIRVVDEHDAAITKFHITSSWIKDPPENSNARFAGTTEEHPDGMAGVPIHARPIFVTFSAENRFDCTIGPISPSGQTDEHTAILRQMALIHGLVIGATGVRPTLELFAVVSDGSDYAWNGLPCRLEPASTGLPKPAARDGSFTLTARKRDRYVVVARAKGFAGCESAPFEYDPSGAGVELELAMKHGGTLEGRVIVEPTASAPSGSPEGVIVGISRGDASGHFMRVGKDGQYHFENLAAGKWSIRRCERDFNAAGESTRSQVTGFDPSLRSFDVEDGKPTHFDLDLKGATSVVDGKIESPLVAHGSLTATLVALPDVPGVKHPSVPIASDGSFHIEAKVLGLHRLEIHGKLGDGSELNIEDTLELKRGPNAWARVLPK